MELMLWLIPASIGLTLIAVGAFVWAVRTSQFEALDRHALDILDETAPVAGSASTRSDSHVPNGETR